MKTAARKQRHSGVDPRGVFLRLMKQEENFDPSKVQVANLTFGTRIRKFPGDNGAAEECEQSVSILDTGTGETVDVYPVVSRFKPREGHEIRCYVVYKKVVVYSKEKRREVEMTIGFAIPVNLREAARNGEWLGVRNNIVKLRFRKSKKDDNFIANGPNGKIVLIPKDAGLVPEDGEANYMVSELLSCYLAHCRVEEEELGGGIKGGTSSNDKGLMLLAESVGATLEAVDTFGFNFGGRLYDACEVLGLPATATQKQVDEAHKSLARTEHPDAKGNEHRRLTNTEPTASDKQQFNHEWALIEAAKEKFDLHLTRQEARNRYLKKGRETMPDLPSQIKVRQLAAKLKVNIAVAKAALKRIGYAVKDGKAELHQAIAWTVVGLFASGEFNPDDLSTEAQGDKEEAPVPPEIAELGEQLGASRVTAAK